MKRNASTKEWLDSVLMAVHLNCAVNPQALLGWQDDIDRLNRT